MSTEAASASRYRELRPPATLRPVVACLWENEPSADLLQRIVPDGCIDLIWMSDGELEVAGADTSFRVAPLPAGVAVRGIRLRAGAAGAFLGWPASEVVDLQVPARELWGEEAARLGEELAVAPADRQRRLLLDAVACRAPAQPDPLASAAARALAAPGARVAEVAAQLGVGERRLHRRILATVGYGPKMLARVARLRRLIAVPEDSLAARAIEAGYADQAHMNAEVRRLTGLTPVRFLQDAALTAA